MSMLSSQADELRTLADKLRIVSFDERANYVENVDTLYRAMGAMREAADTITSLWNSLTVSEAALADAELGSGTCRDVSANPLRFECSECGGVSLEIAPRFCPCCGREVVCEC